MRRLLPTAQGQMLIVPGIRGQILDAATTPVPQSKVQELWLPTPVVEGELSWVDRMAGKPCTKGNTTLSISNVVRIAGVELSHLARANLVEGNESECLC